MPDRLIARIGHTKPKRTTQAQSNHSRPSRPFKSERARRVRTGHEVPNRFFPDKAKMLAQDILNELVKELKIRPCPVVFASFSGGPKACMYKALQLMDSMGESQGNLVKDDYRLVRECLSGLIFDSSPVDFTSDLGTRFALHPSILKMSRPPIIAKWIANGISSSLDALFLTKHESQRAEYWQTLYSTISMRAPYLILCSEDDDLAPYQIVCNFAQRLERLGGDVKFVNWSSSPHVGHYRDHPDEYKAAVSELLIKAVSVYSQRTQQVSGSHSQTSEPLNHLREAVSSSNQYQSFHRITLDLNDHFVVPGSVEYHEGRDMGSIQDEHKERFIPRSSPPKVNANGILGQMLFDVCVPKNIEDWDLKSSSSSYSTIASGRRHSHFNPIKCIRRSRL
ncbi:putative pentatricopeptide repeat-containing protein, mitochondrial-like protein [Tanacetum coccineum]